MIAEKFSRYELREELGRGGMATVYHAYDPMFEREVALKILNRESLNELQTRERLERETKIIARLEHAAIVPVYDVGRDRDQLFFVMRYMAGGSLTERIQRGTLSLAEIGHILQRLAAEVPGAAVADRTALTRAAVVIIAVNDVETPFGPGDFARSAIVCKEPYMDARRFISSVMTASRTTKTVTALASAST